MAFTFWKTYPSRIKRILTIVTFFLLSVIITVAGALTPLSQEEASSKSQELEQLRQNIKNYPQFIFGNNFMICLLMFAPIGGPIFGFYALYNTGVFIAADSITYGVHPLIGFLSLFILPVVWLEVFAYSVAMAESVWLTWRLIQRKVKSELMKACVLISLCAVTLLVAAIIEIAILAMLPQG